MADISTIVGVDGSSHTIKDATARGLLNGHSVNKDVPANAAFTDTTYESKQAASGGTDLSLVTTGEKYNWNGKATKPDMATIALSATWSGSGPYTQTVTVSGVTVTANSKVDLQPDATALAQLIADGVQALYIANNNGTLTAYTVGAAPSVAISNIQCTIVEVNS